MNCEEKIDSFIKYFVEEIQEIKSLKNIIAQKVLYTSIIDTLGRTQSPKGGNRERIVKFVSRFSDWKDEKRVSLPQLNLMLNYVLTDEEKNISKLSQFVKVKLGAWQEGRIYRSDVDPEFEDTISLATPKESKPVHYAMYLELFYAYRNKMVHEFRKPGYGMEMSRDGDTPYYHSYEGRPWQLVFPVEVFHNICIKSLENLRLFLVKRNQDPYDSFEFGDMWIEKAKLISQISRPEAGPV